MWNQLLFNYFKQKSTLTQFISLVPFYTFWKHPKKGPGLWKETINMKSLLVNQNPLREFTILGINYFCYFSLISEDLKRCLRFKSNICILHFMWNFLGGKSLLRASNVLLIYYILLNSPCYTLVIQDTKIIQEFPYASSNFAISNILIYEI